jgi:two-component system LytT family response regulator
MRRLTALIVDDEPLARERLRSLLAADETVEVVGECADGVEALAAIRFASPDVVFLDIQMPGCDGLQVVAQLPEINRPAIIFTTAHEQFALEAFDVAAADYLLKPFDRERLEQAVRRAAERRQAKEQTTPGVGAVEPVAAPRRTERLVFRADGRIVFLRSDEIVWAQADDNYVTLHLTAGRLMIRETLTAIETRLGSENFARINRSAIVHLDQVRELKPSLHGDYTVVLRDGTKLPLSRSLRGRLDRFTNNHEA